jgi:hypothetical protein
MFCLGYVLNARTTPLSSTVMYQYSPDMHVSHCPQIKQLNPKYLATKSKISIPNSYLSKGFYFNHCGVFFMIFETYFKSRTFDAF